jgi:hypothetical protein
MHKLILGFQTIDSLAKKRAPAILNNFPNRPSHLRIEFGRTLFLKPPIHVPAFHLAKVKT